VTCCLQCRLTSLMIPKIHQPLTTSAFNFCFQLPLRISASNFRFEFLLLISAAMTAIPLLERVLQHRYRSSHVTIVAFANCLLPYYRKNVAVVYIQTSPASETYLRRHSKCRYKFVSTSPGK
jgi:hypothetical protein